MLDPRMNVSTFFQEIPRRADGKILIVSIITCYAFLAFNSIEVIADALNLDQTKGSIGTWASWPVVQFVFYIKLRCSSLSHVESSIAYNLICLLGLLGSVVYFALENWNLL